MTRRRALALPVLALVACLAIACSGNEPSPAASASNPTMTAPAATAVPTVTPTARPEPTATPEPPTPTPEPPTPIPPTAVPVASAPPPPPPPPPPTPAPPPPSGPMTLAVKGQVLAFNPRSLSVRTGVSVTIAFENLDVALAHDLGIEGVTTNHTETCAGPCTRNLSFVAPVPGTYNLYCSVHVDMKGQLVVTP